MEYARNKFENLGYARMKDDKKDWTLKDYWEKINGVVIPDNDIITIVEDYKENRLLTLTYFLIRCLSTTFSFHRTTKKPEVWEGDEYKKPLNIRKIVGGRILLVLFFFITFFLLEQHVINLRVFFHEIGHLIVALSFNLQILEVSISVTGGNVDYNGVTTLGQRNLLLISGILWLIFVGMIFLIVLYRDKKLSWTLNASLSIIIWYVLSLDLYNWFKRPIHGIGDFYNLINYNSGLSPLILISSGIIYLILLSAFVFFSLGYKIYSQFKLVTFND